MNTQFIFNAVNNTFKFVTLPESDNITEKLPANTYEFVVNETPFGLETYYRVLPKFTEPSKYYGELLQTGSHIHNFYSHTNKNLGILLYGMSGTGKSLLARKLCLNFMDVNKMPVIVINSNSVQYLQHCLNEVKQPAVFLLDEFEKMFENPDEQGYLLSLLDGVTTSNHVFILTANDKSKINPYFIDRPSRIRYAIEYEKLDTQTVQDILEDLLEDKSVINEVTSILSQLKNLTFDTVTQFALECNAFKDKSPKELANIFNINPEPEYLISNYDISIKMGDKPFTEVLTELLAHFGKSFEVTSTLDFYAETSAVTETDGDLFTLAFCNLEALTNYGYDITLSNVQDLVFHKKGISLKEVMDTPTNKVLVQFANILSNVINDRNTPNETPKKEIVEKLLSYGNTLDIELTRTKSKIFRKFVY